VRYLTPLLFTLLLGCESSVDRDPEEKSELYNKTAYIPSQCYTKREDESGNLHNPCFSCHINSIEPNYIDDGDLQRENSFSEYSKVNRYLNLFKDRSEDIEEISDEEIESYISQNNYSPKWNCYFNFDGEGFDLDSNGSYTGWRAFAYYPFLGTFFPTNGSSDDVLIRLPEEFRVNSIGEENITIYKINLALVESLIKGKDVEIEEIDERIFGVDLNGDSNLSLASFVKYNWRKPDYNISTGKIFNFSMSYVGLAREKMLENSLHIAPRLYPEGTEFLHSVRYISEGIKLSPRMKELRYSKKTNWNSYAQLKKSVSDDIAEREAFPERLRDILGNSQDGLQNGQGWIYKGYIEDRDGNLRVQSYEETLFCIGCHSGIGATVDSSFVFSRKFDSSAFQKGWYYWSQKDLRAVLEPKTADGRYEYSLYLERNGAGDEFRANSEVIEKFFKDGELIESEIERLHSDITHLIYPSEERRNSLNKAYRVIVKEQSYIYGRDPHIKPIENIEGEHKIESTIDVEKVVY
jgi:hypothetical protein